MSKHLPFYIMLEQTRIIRHQNNVYKVKVTFEESNQISEPDEVISFEKMEPVIRAVLYAEERGRLLRLVDTKEYTVSCARKYWKASEKLGFKQNGKTLEAYPYMLLFAVRLKTECHEAPAKRAENSHTNGRKVQKGYTADNTNRLTDFNQNSPQPVVVLTRVSLRSYNQQKNNTADTPVRKSTKNIGTPFLVSERLPEKRKQSTCNIEHENSNSGTKRLRFTHEDRHNSCSPGKKLKFSGGEDSGEQSESESELCDNQLDQSTRKNNSAEAMEMSPIVPKLTEKLRSSRSQRITSVTPQQRGKRTESKSYDSPGLPSTALKNQRKSPRLLNTEAKRSPGPRRATPRRASSGFWRLMETLLTPVKLLTGRRSK